MVWQEVHGGWYAYSDDNGPCVGRVVPSESGWDWGLVKIGDTANVSGSCVGLDEAKANVESALAAGK